MSDFESLPIGTGAELARLNDLVQELASALKVLHPREHVFRTPTDEQEKTIVEALAKAGL